MRIIAGEFGGRRLVAPRGLDTRPTSDRVKEALFNILGPPVPRDGARFRVLDLFAGSGALGLEAISRCADEAVLVEEERIALEAIERNVDAVGVKARVRIVKREVGATITSLGGGGEKFDWIFLDPPYAGGSLDRALRLLSTTPLPAGKVIAEHDMKNPPDERYGKLALLDRRRYGTTELSFYAIETGPAESVSAVSANDPSPEAGASE